MVAPRAVSEDVPESQAQLIERLRAENARLEALIRKLSHDLRTPLGSILGWAEVLLSDSETTPKALRGLETIKRNAQVQAAMLDQLSEDQLSCAHRKEQSQLQSQVKVAAPMPLRPTETPVATLSLEGASILVVDDEPDARELLVYLFEHAGAKVTSVGDVETAIRIVRTIRPDVIVSDIGMPDRDGYQLMRVVRSLPADAGGRTPAVALTAFTRSEDRTRALLAGYQVHIAKPIEPHELLATIGSLIGRTG